MQEVARLVFNNLALIRGGRRGDGHNAGVCDAELEVLNPLDVAVATDLLAAVHEHRGLRRLLALRPCEEPDATASAGTPWPPRWDSNLNFEWWMDHGWIDGWGARPPVALPVEPRWQCGHYCFISRD